MQASQRFYSTRDIMTILNISKTRALQIMHMFEHQGKLLRSGRLMRVEISTFESWLKLNTPAQCRKAV